MFHVVLAVRINKILTKQLSTVLQKDTGNNSPLYVLVVNWVQRVHDRSGIRHMTPPLARQAKKK